MSILQMKARTGIHPSRRDVKDESVGHSKQQIFKGTPDKPACRLRRSQLSSINEKSFE